MGEQQRRRSSTPNILRTPHNLCIFGIPVLLLVSNACGAPAPIGGGGASARAGPERPGWNHSRDRGRSMEMLEDMKGHEAAASKGPTRPNRRRSPRSSQLGVDVLERRDLLSTFTVTNLHNAGAGSLRQAIIASNGHAGPDTIDFAVAGTIRVGRA